MQCNAMQFLHLMPSGVGVQQPRTLSEMFNDRGKSFKYQNLQFEQLPLSCES